MNEHARSGWVTAAIAVAALMSAGAANAQAPAKAERGAGEYMRYCAACHGVDGDGKGLVAPAMKVAPSDLTRLTERHGDPLPRQKLAEFIDGRRPLASHGSREMPVWGERLWKDVPSRTPEMRKRGTILVILDYLESIQRE